MHDDEELERRRVAVDEAHGDGAQAQEGWHRRLKAAELYSLAGGRSLPVNVSCSDVPHFDRHTGVQARREGQDSLSGPGGAAHSSMAPVRGQY